jgi:energy-coupling factor transporter ATP-binding protein EcfA2
VHSPTTAAQVAADLAARVRAAAPRLGRVRLVTVDGPAGSGKSTLAARLSALLDDAPVVHMDDLYEGWTGLSADVLRRLRDGVLDPVADGRGGAFRRYDWDAGRFADVVTVPAAFALVVEGVGAGAREVDAAASLRVWVEVPRDLRLARGLERDGVALRDEWLRWADVEERHFAADGTRDRADAVVDGTAPHG